MPARVFWSRVPAAYVTRSARDIGTQFEEAGIQFLGARIVERGAFNFGETLGKLADDQVPSLENARANAATFVAEVIALLKELRQ
ncbi:hypothetical protein PZN02_006378 (plasmid) [Sinorhizobium garamanticum]|uniref:Uncharacterized protein n=1 Tax=Sinorhizobium garamanticum TaxID=680247 RepID=A0ABY8DMJ8_9HYPH|nr:hypothetical protein [Sinorhizobium garamanticum]WEX91552.1 hypothetical protein PZN02_006378 [Sinorhizobium garamanticum]